MFIFVTAGGDPCRVGFLSIHGATLALCSVYFVFGQFLGRYCTSDLPNAAPNSDFQVWLWSTKGFVVAKYGCEFRIPGLALVN